MDSCEKEDENVECKPQPEHEREREDQDSKTDITENSLGHRKRQRDTEDVDKEGDVGAGSGKRSKTASTDNAAGLSSTSISHPIVDLPSAIDHIEDGEKQARRGSGKGDRTEEVKCSTNSVILSPVVTRSRASEKVAAKPATETPSDNDSGKEIGPTSVVAGELPFAESGSVEGGINTGKRWRVHQMAEDYIGLVGNMMYPGTQLRPYGFDADRREYPLEGVSSLGYLKSPLRRPSVIEAWSPHEIALFEAALLHHGKNFHAVHKVVETKSTKEIIDFYYIWKKTSHYKKWKSQYVSPADLVDIDSPGKGSKI